MEQRGFDFDVDDFSYLKPLGTVSKNVSKGVVKVFVLVVTVLA